MGTRWARVVELWWKLEDSTGWETKTKSHPTKNRPPQVKSAHARSPDLAVEVFAQAWWAWWRGLNPEWRVQDGELVKEGSGSWDVLRYSGQNGFLNIIMCLKWWKAKLDGEADDWKAAADDMIWVLERMMG
ncbi:hypothetical protein DFH09DRAFT_941798 [Mycena vulgaris]|nr:hypothetical protein DFH09DRAFT_941798 [Mycena vulgaris]